MLLEDTFCQSDTPAILETIRDPAYNLAIWKRDIRPDLAALTDHLPRSIDLETVAAELCRELNCAVDTVPASLDPVWQWLLGDVAMLAGHYCAIMRLEHVRLRLEVVETDACRKFHSDWVSARLITTYLGRGTQWLRSADAELLERGQEPRHIASLDTGDVGLFKGKLATSHPVIHRSPPIAGTGEKRLLLVLDPPTDSAEA